MTVGVERYRVGESRQLLLVDDLTRTQLVQYAGASGDYNPLHTDEIYATRAAGYPTVFAHGMWTMGATARVVTDWVGDGRITRYGARFRQQVWPGDSLTATAVVTALRQEGAARFVDLAITTTNQAGVEILTGYASARIDP